MTKAVKKTSNVPFPTCMEQAFSAFEDSPFWPLIMVAMNGMSLGTAGSLVAKHATNYQFKKVFALIDELNRRIDSSLVEPGSEDFYAALQISLNAVLETQSTQKAGLFASVLAGTWSAQFSKWDEVSQTLRLIRSLEDVHISILREALEVHISADGGNATFSIGSGGFESSARLDELLTHIDPMLLTSCISDLISTGLLNDSFESSSVARFSGESVNEKPKPARLAYSISPLGIWFLNKIADPEFTTNCSAPLAN